MKKNAMTKIIASLAFFWIVLSIIGTGLLIIFWEDNQQPVQQEFTTEQMAEIQKMIDSQSWSITNSGTIEIPELEELEKETTK
jgi:preprotein translocase subunit SecG